MKPDGVEILRRAAEATGELDEKIMAEAVNVLLGDLEAPLPTEGPTQRGGA